MAKRLVAIVDDDVHDTWHAYAKAHGCTPTTLFESIAERLLAGHTEPGEPIRSVALRGVTRAAARKTAKNRKRKG